MTPFGFLGGIHLTSMQADPSALRTGEFRSMGAASAVLANILLLTPQPPWKKKIPLVICQVRKRATCTHRRVGIPWKSLYLKFCTHSSTHTLTSIYIFTGFEYLNKKWFLENPLTNHIFA